jgi:pyrroloquinoline quinone (PQQ) biosynthesis protein C
MQAVAPSGFKVHYDVNFDNTVERVLDLARELVKFPIAGAIEDPLRTHDFEGHRILRQKCPLPIYFHPVSRRAADLCAAAGSRFERSSWQRSQFCGRLRRGLQSSRGFGILGRRRFPAVRRDVGADGGGTGEFITTLRLIFARSEGTARLCRIRGMKRDRDTKTHPCIPASDFHGHNFYRKETKVMAVETAERRSVAQEDIAQFVQELEGELVALPVHTHPFFQSFERLSREQLREFVKQWYVFGREFRRILIGLLYNVVNQDEEVALEVLRTVWSEMGNGRKEHVHSNVMLITVDALSIPHGELASTRLIPEAQDYIDTMGDLFLHGDLPSALGASYGIESTAGLIYRHMYGALLRHFDLHLTDIKFFEVHLFEELNHSDFLTTAVMHHATPQNQAQIRRGAFLAMEKWQRLWDGMHRHVVAQQSAN